MDQIQYSYCKYVLGLPRHCVNDVATGELGRCRISIFAVFRKIKYWLQLLKHDEMRYTNICYRHSLQLANNDTQCWAWEIKNILHITGFGYVWSEQSVANDKLFLNQFLQRLIDIDKQAWNANISSMDKLYIYKQFKVNNYYEFYLAHLESNFYRFILCKFRCCCFNLEVHSGRKFIIPREHRLCTVCNQKKVEDEFHFLLQCPIYDELRRLYIPSFFYNYPTYDKLSLLINTLNKTLLLNLSKFLYHAWRYRSQIVNAEI